MDNAISEWLQMLDNLNEVRKQTPWEMADLMKQGIDAFCQDKNEIADLYNLASEQLEISRKTLMNYVSCARTFPPERRRERLEIGHHIAVLGMDEEVQDDILSKAESQGWTVAQVRKEVAAPSNDKPWIRPTEVERLFYNDALPLSIDTPNKAWFMVGGRRVVAESSTEIKWRIE